MNKSKLEALEERLDMLQTLKGKLDCLQLMLLLHWLSLWHKIR